MKKITKLILLLVAVPFMFCSCSQDDDVNEIFDSGVWYLANYYKYVDWDSNNDTSARPVYVKPEDMKIITEFSIVFDKDGTFSGSLYGGGTIAGRWEADPKGRTFSIIGPIKATGDQSGKNGEFIKTLQNAKYYRGDSKMMLRLAPESKTSCMQFRHFK